MYILKESAYLRQAIVLNQQDGRGRGRVEQCGDGRHEVRVLLEWVQDHEGYAQLRLTTPLLKCNIITSRVNLVFAYKVELFIGRRLCELAPKRTQQSFTA